MYDKAKMQSLTLTIETALTELNKVVETGIGKYLGKEVDRILLVELKNIQVHFSTADELHVYPSFQEIGPPMEAEDTIWSSVCLSKIVEEEIDVWYCDEDISALRDNFRRLADVCDKALREKGAV